MVATALSPCVTIGMLAVLKSPGLTSLEPHRQHNGAQASRAGLPLMYGMFSCPFSNHNMPQCCNICKLATGKFETEFETPSKAAAHYVSVSVSMQDISMPDGTVPEGFCACKTVAACKFAPFCTFICMCCGGCSSSS